MGNYVSGLWGSCLANFEQIWTDITSALRGLAIQDGIFLSDNLVAWERNLSFLDDEKFMRLFTTHAQNQMEQGIIWRTHIFVWCVEQALRRKGDLVECGCYKGTSARIACDYVGFEAARKKFYLYDLFEHTEDMPHHGMPEHGPGLYESVRRRFQDLPNVKIVRGKVPEVFERVCPRRIAFLHLDMNNAAAEAGALDVLFDRMTPGALVLLDDYGWIVYRSQKLAADQFLARRGLRPVELPTGQALVLI